MNPIPVCGFVAVAARATQGRDDIMFHRFGSWLRLRLDVRAVTAIEYAMIACMVGIAGVAGSTVIGTKLRDIFAAAGAAFTR
jgi:Flp pilus assembly pilin Flp